MPPLGMADDRVAASGVLQHLGADAAGERARGGGWQSWPPSATPLPASASPTAPSNVNGGQTSRSQRCGALARSAISRASAQPVGAQHVHLPVAGDKPFSFRHLSILPARRGAGSRRGCDRARAYLSSFAAARSHRDSPRVNRPATPGPATSSHLAMMQAIRGRAGSIVIKILFGLLILSFGAVGHLDTCSDYPRHSPETSLPRSATTQHPADEVQRNCSRPWSGCARSSAAASTCSAEAARHRRNVLEPADRPRPVEPGGAAARARSVRTR